MGASIIKLGKEDRQKLENNGFHEDTLWILFRVLGEEGAKRELEPAIEALTEETKGNRENVKEVLAFVNNFELLGFSRLEIENLIEHSEDEGAAVLRDLKSLFEGKTDNDIQAARKKLYGTLLNLNPAENTDTIVTLTAKGKLKECRVPINNSVQAVNKLKDVLIEYLDENKEAIIDLVQDLKLTYERNIRISQLLDDILVFLGAQEPHPEEVPLTEGELFAAIDTFVTGDITPDEALDGPDEETESPLPNAAPVALVTDSRLEIIPGANVAFVFLRIGKNTQKYEVPTNNAQKAISMLKEALENHLEGNEDIIKNLVEDLKRAYEENKVMVKLLDQILVFLHAGKTSTEDDSVRNKLFAAIEAFLKGGSVAGETEEKTHEPAASASDPLPASASEASVAPKKLSIQVRMDKEQNTYLDLMKVKTLIESKADYSIEEIANLVAMVKGTFNPNNPLLKPLLGRIEELVLEPFLANGGAHSKEKIMERVAGKVASREIEDELKRINAAIAIAGNRFNPDVEAITELVSIRRELEELSTSGGSSPVPTQPSAAEEIKIPRRRSISSWRAGEQSRNLEGEKVTIHWGKETFEISPTLKGAADLVLLMGRLGSRRTLGEIMDAEKRKRLQDEELLMTAEKRTYLNEKMEELKQITKDKNSLRLIGQIQDHICITCDPNKNYRGQSTEVQVTLSNLVEDPSDQDPNTVAAWLSKIQGTFQGHPTMPGLIRKTEEALITMGFLSGKPESTSQSSADAVLPADDASITEAPIETPAAKGGAPGKDAEAPAIETSRGKLNVGWHKKARIARIAAPKNAADHLQTGKNAPVIDDTIEWDAVEQSTEPFIGDLEVPNLVLGITAAMRQHSANISQSVPPIVNQPAANESPTHMEWQRDDERQNYLAILYKKGAQLAPGDKEILDLMKTVDSGLMPYLRCINDANKAQKEFECYMDALKKISQLPDPTLATLKRRLRNLVNTFNLQAAS